MSEDNNPGFGESLCPGFSNSQRQQYENMLAEARTNVRETEQLLKRALAFAGEWQDDKARLLALDDLHKHYVRQGKYAKGIICLEEEYKTRLRVFGKKDPAIARIKKNIGLCYVGLRQLDKGIEQLREAVLLCQKSTEDLTEDIVDGLINLAAVYRQKESADQARVCIRQAFVLVDEEDVPREWQVKVLDELAAVTLAQHRLKAAEQALLKVLRMKQEIYGVLHPEYAVSLLLLGNCYTELKKPEEAENCFLQAIDILHRTARDDRDTLAAALQKLAGIYHQQGRFIESTFMEQRISEIIGRAPELRLGFYKNFDAGFVAQMHKHYDVAFDCYSDALMKLEFTWGKNALVRVPLLCRLLEIAAIRKQKPALKSFRVELEEIMIVGQTKGDNHWQRLKHVARMFRVIGHDTLSEGCYRIACKYAREANDMEALIELLEEHTSLLDRMHEKKEAARKRKFLRRLRRLLARRTPQLSAGFDDDDTEILEVTYFQLSTDALPNQALLVVFDEDK